MLKQILWILFWSAVGVLVIKGLKQLHPSMYLLKIIIAVCTLLWAFTMVYGFLIRRRK